MRALRIALVAVALAAGLTLAIAASMPTERKVLLMTSATSPALVTSGYGAGGPWVSLAGARTAVVALECTNGGGDAGSSMTGCNFEVQVSRDGTNVAATVRGAQSSDATATLKSIFPVTVSAGSTTRDGIETDAIRDWPYVRVVAQAVGANAGSGDVAAAYVESQQP